MGVVVLWPCNDTVMTASITAKWGDIGLPAGAQATVRDLWLHREMGTFNGSYGVVGLVPRQSVTVRVTPVKASDRETVVRNASSGEEAARPAPRATSVTDLRRTRE